jgi:hypothetical protein
VKVLACNDLNQEKYGATPSGTIRITVDVAKARRRQPKEWGQIATTALVTRA